MQKLTAQQIRSSFVNASRSEAAKLNLPPNFDALDWDSLDFLGWRDGKMPLRGYLVLAGPNGPTGMMLRAPEGGPKKNRAVLCELCRDIYSKDDVLLWVAKRAGQSGRNGNTVGTLICADFGCCRNVRVEPPVNEINPDPAAVVRRQIDDLAGRTAQFLNRVRGT
ncbi:FBP domain-containing protein [Pseudarthrobacter sp. 1C304]|uniref:FBP domain-containing protein n=1 Tax=Pseudarthrobacter sp. 1C304 TaxID=3457438 RepID=UPI003FCFE501